jgi:type II secretory pathway pseudopilin PulG
MRLIRTQLHHRAPGNGRQTHPSLVAAAVAAALGALSSPAAMSQAASAADLQNLQEQVQKLQREIDRMQAQQQAQSSNPTTPAQSSAPLTASPKDSGKAATAPSPSFMAGPVKVTLNGFVELMVVNRDRNESADWASNFNGSIPYPNSHNYFLSEFHLTERQSRVASLIQGPDSDTWDTEAYLEMDFGGAGGTANNNESSSFSPRARHYFADITYKPYGANLLFGQTWSLITGFKQGLTARQENIPLTIDGQYVPGFDWVRLSQVRYTQKFNDMFSAAVSAENPAALVTANASTGAPALNTIFNNPGASNSFTPPNGSAFAANNITLDYLPDLVAKVAVDPGYGHFEVFATERFFRSRDIVTGQQKNLKTNATGFGGSMILPVVPKMVDFQASVIAGRAVGRYGSAQLPDATINAGTLGVEPLRGFSALAGLIVKPAPAWTLFSYVGEEQVNRRDFFLSTGGKTYAYGYGSSAFDNSGCETEGVGVCAANTSRIVSGTVGGWWKFYQGWLGNGQLGLTDTWIKREIFSGIGGDPSTNINITMVSFRYYPFQK